MKYLTQAFFTLNLCAFFSSLQSSEPFLQNIQQLTFSQMGFEKAGEAYFSPDSRMIIFQAVPKGEKNYQIYTLKIGEEKPLLVSTGKGSCTCAFFRPDGKKIIFASSHSDPRNEIKEDKNPAGKYVWDLTPYMNIYEANVDGSELTPLTFGPSYHAECAYSPDGSEIVYASNESGSMNLYIMNSDGSQVRQITHTNTSYNGGPFFSPTGDHIIFRTDRDKKDFLQIFLTDKEGNETQLTNNGAVNWAPFWHPNGKVIAYTTSLHGHHQYELYLMNIETGIECRLTENPSFDGLPVFNTTGNQILWTSKRNEGTCHVFLADFIMPNTLN
ncbi:MAG: PD40 domain-containing protein [Verrucomicrobia bacterium]|nr:PD40 domain-containing protein [Verrucomicrobiota bacterium]